MEFSRIRRLPAPVQAVQTSNAAVHFGASQRPTPKLPQLDLIPLLAQRLDQLFAWLESKLGRLLQIAAHPRAWLHELMTPEVKAVSVRSNRASTSPFAKRGLMEGFYGLPYTVDQRDDMLKFLAKHGYNYYVYGPKDDVWHRERWSEPYPADKLAELKRNIKTAQEEGITFNYAVSPGGGSLCYASDADFNKVTAKLQPFFDAGVRSFSLFFDDIESVLVHQEDRERFGSYAAAHADFANRLSDWLKRQSPDTELVVCPTFYAGGPPFDPYVKELGQKLKPEIDLYYTGPDICSKTIPTDMTGKFAEESGRKPIIWDNYPVNDAGMTNQIHLEPIKGREANLFESAKGIMVNTMSQVEASKIALATYGDYLDHPDHYDPKASLQKALTEIGGPGSEEALTEIVNSTAISCLEKEPNPLKPLVDDLLAAAGRGETLSGQPAFKKLDEALTRLDKHCTEARQTVRNPNLMVELGGWIENLRLGAMAGKSTLRLLEEKEKGEPTELTRLALELQLRNITRLGRRTRCEDLQPLIDYALSQTEKSKLNHETD